MYHIYICTDGHEYVYIYIQIDKCSICIYSVCIHPMYLFFEFFVDLSLLIHLRIISRDIFILTVFDMVQVLMCIAALFTCMNSCMYSYFPAKSPTFIGKIPKNLRTRDANLFLNL